MFYGTDAQLLKDNVHKMNVEKMKMLKLKWMHGHVRKDKIMRTCENN